MGSLLAVLARGGILYEKGLAIGLAGVHFLYSATVEERYLTEQFPDAYPAYKQSTKMLVPFIS